MIIDLAKCYEHARHIRPALEANRIDFPMVLLRTTIRAYEWPRKLTIDKRVCVDLFPTRAFIAGCALANTGLKAFMFRLCSYTIARKPKVSTSISIDGFTIDGQAAKGEVVENVVAAAVGLTEICEDDLKMPIAQNKLAVVASDDLLAAGVGKRLGSQHFSQSQARNLGVGYRRGQG